MQMVLLLSLVLFSFAHYGHAQPQQDKVAQKTSRSKGKGKQRTPRKKTHSKQVHNMLHPFTLRLLYTPSYRFLTKAMRDNIEESKNDEENKVSLEIAQFLPLSMGLEGEFAFNQWVSLAISGSFTWQDEFVVFQPNSDELREIFKKTGYEQSSKFYEYVVGSTLYGNVFNYFKLGVGAELAFRNMDFIASQTEKGKKLEDKSEVTWKRASAHLALRRDFFLARVGFGIGFNASMALGDVFDRQNVDKSYLDGKLQKPGEGETTEEGNDDDDGDEGFYGITLMPVLYVAF